MPAAVFQEVFVAFFHVMQNSGSGCSPANDPIAASIDEPSLDEGSVSAILCDVLTIEVGPGIKISDVPIENGRIWCIYRQILPAGSHKPCRYASASREPL